MHKIFGINIIDPAHFGPYSIHLVPMGTFQHGKHGNYRLKILLGSKVVGYLKLLPIVQ